MPFLLLRGSHRHDRGSVLVISIIVLFILTMLGLALMLSSAAESDIAANHRWGEMAFYNADAGLEYGKNVLAAYVLRDGDFGGALPATRTAAEMSTAPPDATCNPDTQPGCRDYQFSLNRVDHVIYIGRVLRDPGGRPLQFDFRNPVAGDLRGDIDGDGVQDVQGTVTLWVRRPVTSGVDYAQNDRAILTAEGTAPTFGMTASGRPGSIRRLEVVIAVSAGGLAPSNTPYTDTSSGGLSDGSMAPSDTTKRNVN